MSIRVTLGFRYVVAALICAAISRPDSARAADRPVTLNGDQAIARALNEISRDGEAYVLKHPRYTARFDRDGMAFSPRGGELAWRWRLRGARAGSEGDLSMAPGTAELTARDGTEVISFERGAFREEYLVKKGTIEQRFVIPAALDPKGGDLVIEGAVESNGSLRTVDDGWVWARGGEEVKLGQVYVFDRNRKPIAATMTVSAGSTAITVDGSELARAAYPVTIDPEIGPNDQKISDTGDPMFSIFSATEASVAFNAIDNMFLVVWAANEDLTDGPEFEIYGQLIDGETGTEIGPDDFRISVMGADGDNTQEALSPDVVWNSVDNEFLVVWWGDNYDGVSGPPALQDEEYEIWAQRISPTGGLLGGMVRVSNMGIDGDPVYQATTPAVAYNSANNEYMIVWSSDDKNSGQFLDDDDIEIFGRIMTNGGTLVGTTHFRISEMGPPSINMTPPRTNFAAMFPDVVYNDVNNEYLVVWEGDDFDISNAAPPNLQDDEFEIFGQLLDDTGAEIGPDDFRISSMGPDGVASMQAAASPAVAFNSFDNQYLVVWRGDEALAEFEIFGQLLNAGGGEIGADDFQISVMGPMGNPNFGAGFNPSVAFSPIDLEYFVVWSGDDDSPPLVDNEFEIFGRYVNADGSLEGSGDLPLSDIGAPGDPSQAAVFPAVAHNPLSDRYLVAFEGDEMPLDFEIHTQLIVQRVADLSITVSAAPDPAPIGGNLDYVVNVDNLGPDTAVGIDLTSVLPPELSLVNVSGSGWICAALAPPNVLCSFPSAPPGPLPPLTISATVLATTSTSVTSSIASFPMLSFDPDGINNFASVTTGITDPTPPPSPPPAEDPTLSSPGEGSKSTNPIFSGTGFPGADITLTLDGTVLSPTVKADANGEWNFPFLGTLSIGNHVLEVQSVDPFSRQTALFPARAFVVTGGAQLDFDGDGLSDGITYSAFGGKIEFRSFDTSSDRTSRFVLSGEVAATGDYDGDEVYDYATISRSGSDLLWTVATGATRSTSSFVLGRRGDFAVTGCRFVMPGLTSAAVFDGSVLTAVNAADPGTLQRSAAFPSGSKIIGCVDTDGDELDEPVFRQKIPDSSNERIVVARLDGTEVGSFVVKAFFKGYVIPGPRIRGGHVALVRQQKKRLTLTVHDLAGSVVLDGLSLPQRGILSSGVLLDDVKGPLNGFAVFDPSNRSTAFYDLSSPALEPVALDFVGSGFKIVQAQYVYKSTAAGSVRRQAFREGVRRKRARRRGR